MPKQPLISAARVSIPVDHVEAVRASLLELHQVCADALSHASLRHLRTGDSLSEVQACRAELAALDGLLDEIGWPGQAAREGPVLLRGPRPPLREAAWLALTHATAALDEAAAGYWSGAVDVAALSARVETVSARLTLLARLESG